MVIRPGHKAIAELLSPSDARDVLLAILSRPDDIPPLDGPAACVYAIIKEDADKISARQSKNGKKGGAPAGNKNAKKTTQNNPKQPKTDDRVQKIIGILNDTLGTKYKACAATVKHIKARLAEGFTVEDFETVVTRQKGAWGADEKMSKYLRPETLFGTKFESYLNAVPVGKKSGIDWEGF
jgi:uncharacterized phage protein (TIGR02220 family)